MMTSPLQSAAVFPLAIDLQLTGSGCGAVAATSEVARLFHPDLAFFQPG
jgi:hypothetical protein